MDVQIPNWTYEPLESSQQVRRTVFVVFKNDGLPSKTWVVQLPKWQGMLQMMTEENSCIHKVLALFFRVSSSKEVMAS